MKRMPSRFVWSLNWLVVLSASLASIFPLTAEDKPPSILDIPRIMHTQTLEQTRAVQLLVQGRVADARDCLQQAIKRVPHDSQAHYNLACAYAQLNEEDLAFEYLQRAVELGYRDRKSIEKDSDLKSLREKPRFQEILKACDLPMTVPRPGWTYNFSVAGLSQGVITVDAENCVFNEQTRLLHVLVDTTGAGAEQIVISPAVPEYRLLNEWFKAGTAAGNVGDLYDNHDRSHSPLALARYPQMTAIQFGPQMRQRQLDNGLQATLLFQKQQPKSSPRDDDLQDTTVRNSPLQFTRTVVLGNSSTAVTDPVYWRSQPRLALTSPGGSSALVNHYFNNHIYIYPEHRDHDPGFSATTGWGDVYFANTPYYVISQGSSGTDQVFLQALAATLASFKPEVKQRLTAEGMIAPTLQMILRRCYGSLYTDEEYLTQAAHPTVFDGSQLHPERMMRLAHSLEVDKLPPLVQLQVLQEFLGNPQVDYFDAQACEQLLTSPCAISRACLSTRYWRQIDISTSGSKDLNGLPLTYHWVLLRGDPARVTIEPIAEQPLARRIKVAYHERRPITEGSQLASCRVDIGVFADNGTTLSAPAFISFYFPDNEKRTYDEDGQIVAVDYQTAQANYADPLIAPRRDWRDEYHYLASGQANGWTRFRGSEREEFDASGKLKPTASDGKSSKASREVRYQRTNGADGHPLVQQLGN